MNKMYNKYIFQTYHKLLTVNNNTPVIINPGEQKSYGWNFTANADNDPTENKNKVPILFGQPLVYFTDDENKTFLEVKEPLNLFAKVYYVKRNTDTQKMTVYIFIKNFTNESITFNAIYLPIFCTEYCLVYD